MACVSLTLEGVGTLAGPLIAGVVIETAGVGLVFAFGAVAYVAAALTLAAVHVEGRLRFAHHRAESDLTAGFRLGADVEVARPVRGERPQAQRDPDTDERRGRGTPARGAKRQCDRRDQRQLQCDEHERAHGHGAAFGGAASII